MTRRCFYLVRPERWLHFPNFPAAHRVWAKPGEYVEATHPLLQTWIKDQLGKVQSVAVVPRGSVFMDESKLPRGVAQTMAEHDKGHRGIPVTTEPVYADGPEAAPGASESDATGSTPEPAGAEEGAKETASAAAGESGGIPDVQPPAKRS